MNANLMEEYKQSEVKAPISITYEEWLEIELVKARNVISSVSTELWS